MPIRHAFTSPKADGGDATLVRPSDWNADHVGGGAAGWQPFAYPIHFVANATYTVSTVLAANGGSIAIPIMVTGAMSLERALVRTTDSTLARSLECRLYSQTAQTGDSGENTLTEVSGTDASLSYTAASATTRALVFTGAPVDIDPGVYWLVVRNTHATNTLGLGSASSATAFANNSAQTKTIGALGSTLDFVAATWAKVTGLYAVRLDGRVFGQTTQF